MNRTALALCLAILAVAACGRKPAEKPVMDNPFFSEFATPFGVPPFDAIQPEHYVPAFERGMAEQKKEIGAITASAEAPTFANTVEALERSGALLARVSGVFGNMTSSHTNEALQQIDKDMAPRLAQHGDDIALNAALFARVKAVYDGRGALALSPEEARLLDETYKDFVRGGAALPADKQARLRQINEELSVLSVQFGENVLKENNAFELVIDVEADLAGLPPAVVAGAADAARERGKPGRWVFTLHKPSLIPFLQFSAKRELREKMFKAYVDRGANGNELDNRAAGLEDGGPEGRTGRTPGLQDPRRLRPRKEHGQDAPGRLRFSEPALDAVPGPGQGRSGRHAGDDPGRGRRLRARALGLVVLRGEGQEGQLRPRRYGPAALFPARERPRRRLHGRRQALRHHASPSAPTSPSTTRTSGSTRSRTPTAPTWPSCTSITTPAPPSRAGPG